MGRRKTRFAPREYALASWPYSGAQGGLRLVVHSVVVKGRHTESLIQGVPKVTPPLLRVISSDRKIA